MSELMCETFVRALPDLSLVVRRDGVIVANLGGRDLGVDYAPGELHGTTLKELWTPEIAARLHQLVRRALKTRATVEQRYEFQGRQYEARVRPQSIDRVLMILRALSDLPVLLPVAMAESGDPASMLDSRDAFERRLSVAAANAKLRQSTFALAVVNLGGLREIEATLGIAFAERLMTAALDRLAVPRPILGSAPRPRPTAARDGNGLIAVLLDQAPGADAIGIEIERIRRTLAEPLEHEGRCFHLRPTLAIARYPDDGTNPQLLHDKAHAALSEALRCERENGVVYCSDSSWTTDFSPELDSQLRRALQTGELTVRYSPVVEIVGRRTQSLEALIRWTHPACGQLPPERFLPLAQTTDLGADIDRWVLERACRDLGTLRSAGHTRLRIGFNTGRRLLDTEDFVERVVDGAAAAQIALGSVDIDVQERYLAAGGPALGRLRRLRERGVRVFADGCGNGSVALSRIATLPVDGLKLDRRFVAQIEDDPDSRAICNSVISIARAFGLRSVATGVETRGQLDFLRECRCDAAQGFLFCAPQLLQHFMPLRAV
jgi:predicted signal transduction protein with EAL and GGDEF domain